VVKVRALDRKLARDLWRLKWQAAAITLLIACGVAVMVMAYSAQKALVAAQAQFYQDTRFGDVFIQAKRAPLSLAADLRRLEGVTAVDARIVEAGLMAVPGLDRPAVATVISLPDTPRGGLNSVQLARGRMPDPARADEAVGLSTFLDAAKVRLGDRLTATIAGRAFNFTVVGAVNAPEYVFVPSPESLMPDDAHQGVFWAPRAAVERAAGMSGGFNSVSATLAAGASVPAALMELDRRLSPYGGRNAYARADQISHAFLQAELKELSTSAAIIPPVFLLVAAALVHILIARLVESEREQIGLLKAFGYSDLEASSTYVKLAAAIGLFGALIGAAAGGGFGVAIMDIYHDYFRFPELAPAFSWPSFAAAAAASMLAAMGGSLSAARRAARLSPAVAMQPPRPAAYRAGCLDRLIPAGAIDQATRMIVRNIERFPGRAAFAVAGLAASLTLLVGTQFVFDSLEAVIDQAYYRAQRWSQQVQFLEARAEGAVEEARRLPGAYAAEPVRLAAVRLKSHGREERLRLVGLEPGALMAQPLDAADRPIPFKGRGIIMSEALARRLGVRPGETVWLEFLEGHAAAAEVRVTALARDYSGLTAYMDRRELNRMLGDGDVANAAQLLVAADLRPAFYRAVAAIPQIIGASSRDDAVANWRQAMTQAFEMMMTFYVGFAAAIAFGVAYNTSRIALSERARDLATLRVLGFSESDCAWILFGELAVLTLVATPLGLLGGNALAQGLAASFSRDDLRLPMEITAKSYGISLSAYFIAVALAAMLVAGRIWRLDLVAVLKTRD